MTTIVHLQQNGFDLDIAPKAGGGIARLDWQGMPLLRPAVSGAVEACDPLGLSCFPMTPYISRITDGKFVWGDVATQIAPNMAGGSHPLHGIGWRKPWEIISQSSSGIELALNHLGDADWPWAFETRQSFQICTDHVVHELSVTSKDSRPFPCSLGPHPYFNSNGARIQFHADALWEISGESLPTVKARAPVVNSLAVGVAAHDLNLDHCFEGWDGRATITWPYHGVHINSQRSIDDVHEMCSRLQLYTPLRSGFFCLEPVTARCVAFLEPEPETHGVVELRHQELKITTTFTPFRRR